MLVSPCFSVFDYSTLKLETSFALGRQDVRGRGDEEDEDGDGRAHAHDAAVPPSMAPPGLPPCSRSRGGQRFTRGTIGWGGRLRRERESGESPNARSEVCHLRRLSKPYYRFCMSPFTTQLYPLYKDYKEMIIKVANPFAMKAQRLHRRGVSVCACAGPLRTDTMCGVLLLVQTEPGSRALTRAAAWTSVLPGPAQDHHGHEDSVGRVGRREDQMQEDPGKLRHRHQADPRKRQ